MELLFLTTIKPQVKLYSIYKQSLLALVCWLHFLMIIRHLNLVYVDEIKQISHLWGNIDTEKFPLAQSSSCNSVYILYK